MPEQQAILETLQRIATALEQISLFEPQQRKPRKSSPAYKSAPSCPIITKSCDWKEKIASWMGEHTGRGGFTTDEILKGVFELDAEKAKMQTRRTLGAELRAQGYEQRQNFRNGLKGYFWTKQKEPSAYMKARDAKLAYILEQSKKRAEERGESPLPVPRTQGNAQQHKPQAATSYQQAANNEPADDYPEHREPTRNLLPTLKAWLETNVVKVSYGVSDTEICQALNADRRAVNEMLPAMGLKKIFLSGKQCGPMAGICGYFWSKPLTDVDDLI